MGTDIHLEVEVFDRKASRWRNVVGAVPDSFITPVLRGSHEWATCIANPDAPGGRCYYVFAFLAGVRDGDGLHAAAAEAAPPVDGRGLPGDMDGNPNDGDLDLGEHSQTWATLAELRTLPWDIRHLTSGWIEHGDWLEWLDRRATAAEPWREWPKSWCKWAGGPNIRHVDAAEVDALPDRGAAMVAGMREVRPNAQLYIVDRWACLPVADSGFRRWLSSPLMNALERDYGPAGVRVLMGFDS